MSQDARRAARRWCSFVVSSETLTPVELAGRLGVTPDFVEIRGTLVSKRIPDRVAAHHIWMIEEHGDDDDWLTTLFDRLLQRLMPATATLRELVGAGLVETGFHSVQRIADADRSGSGFWISPETVAWAAAVEAGFDLDQSLRSVARLHPRLRDPDTWRTASPSDRVRRARARRVSHTA